jgi:hypothetical protein
LSILLQSAAGGCGILPQYYRSAAQIILDFPTSFWFNLIKDQRGIEMALWHRLVDPMGMAIAVYLLLYGP